MAVDGLLKDLRQSQEGVLGVDDEEKTDYIYIIQSQSLVPRR